MYTEGIHCRNTVLRTTWFNLRNKCLNNIMTISKLHAQLQTCKFSKVWTYNCSRSCTHELPTTLMGTEQRGRTECSILCSISFLREGGGQVD